MYKQSMYPKNGMFWYLIYKELLTIAMAGELTVIIFLALCINTITAFNLYYKLGTFAILLLISWIVVKIALKLTLTPDLDIDTIELDENTSFSMSDTIYKTQTIFKYGIVILIGLAMIPVPMVKFDIKNIKDLEMVLIIFITNAILSTCCIMTFNEIVANLLERLSRDI